jgi:thioredoxin-like negative regulator of GroEL
MNFCAKTYMFLFYLFIMALPRYSGCSENAAKQHGGDTMPQEIVEITEQEWEDELNAQPLAVMVFSTPMCAACKELEPIFMELAFEYRDYATFSLVDDAEDVERFGIRGFLLLR